MKALLVALNASFIHTNLAVRLLQKSTHWKVDILELTINEKKDYIIKKIFQINPSHIFWSAYIWNWELIKDLGEVIYKIDPSIKQFVGGPEVTYDLNEHLNHNPWMDGVLIGEGEETFKQLIDRLRDNKNWLDIPGLAYRDQGKNHINQNPMPQETLDHLPQLDYKDEDVKNRILYYEAMRGCPYNCSYCLSSLDERVRYRSIKKVKEDLMVLFATGTKQIKFVDRSFGINKDRAIELLDFMRANDPGDINIHLEMNLENLDQRIIDILVEAREGLFQIEAGVQSTNLKVLDSIDRRTDIDSIHSSMKKLGKGKIHRHLDLIIGLPGENMESFLKGFDDLYKMRPERIQVGFLKLLRGTTLRKHASDLGISYEEKAPYTVIQTSDLSGREIIFLKTFENIIETYCDEHKFYHTNKYIIEVKGKKPSEYFTSLAEYYNNNLDKYKSNTIKGKYKLLYDYIHHYYEDAADILYDYLKLDFYLQEDHFIERVLPVEDKEMNKSEVMEWLGQIDEGQYKELGKDIHRASRMCRGIRFGQLKKESLFLYKNHKYIRHFSRIVGGKNE